MTEEAPIEKIPLRINYTVYTRTKRVEMQDGSWWVQFDGSWESLNFGGERKPFEEGDMIKITFEKVIQNA